MTHLQCHCRFEFSRLAIFSSSLCANIDFANERGWIINWPHSLRFPLLLLLLDVGKKTSVWPPFCVGNRFASIFRISFCIRPWVNFVLKGGDISIARFRKGGGGLEVSSKACRHMGKRKRLAKLQKAWEKWRRREEEEEELLKSPLA